MLAQHVHTQLAHNYKITTVGLTSGVCLLPLEPQFQWHKLNEFQISAACSLVRNIYIVSMSFDPRLLSCIGSTVN